MATKRKSIAQLKAEKKQRKKPKDEEEDGKCVNLQVSSKAKPFNVEKSEESVFGKSSKLAKGQSAGQSLYGVINTGSTIISCFRKQKQQDVKSVKCPMCERLVLYHKVNQHLDAGCSEEFVIPCERNSSVSLDLELKSVVKSGDQNELYEEPCSVLGEESHMHLLSKGDSHDTVDNQNNRTAIYSNDKTLLSLGNTSMETTNASDKYLENNTVRHHSSIKNMDSNISSKSSIHIADSSTMGMHPSCILEDGSQILENEISMNHTTSYKSKKLNHTKSSSMVEEVIINEMIIDSVDSAEPEQINILDHKENVSVVPQSGEIQTITSNEDGSGNVYEPYYLQNFMLTLNTVLSHKDDKELFDNSDNAVVTSFQNLSECARKLYVRLFQRKFKWFQMVKIQYPRIGEDLQPFFQELIDCGLVQTEAKLVDLEEILKLLPASDVQELAKSMHIINKKEGRSKKQLMQSLVKHSTRQCSLFASNGDRIAIAIVKRAKTLLGPCVKLESFPRNVFSRVLLLFTLNLLADDDDNTGSQFSALFLINIGRVVYPTYEISRETAIFCSRDDLISYEMANQELSRMDDAMENKNFDEARIVYDNVKGKFMESLSDLANGEPRLMNMVNLPIHLRRFTCTWLYTKMCSRGIELLQRSKEYTDAVDLLRQLLGQDIFCVSHRGWWWERLALNLDQHLKKPSEALDAVREGLSDVRVRTGHRFALEQRAKKICEAKRNSSLRKHLTEINFTELKQPTVVTISGKRLSNEPVFVLHEVNTDGSVDDDVVSYCGVEEMALRYYRQQGYNEGIHGEGSTFNTLFGLLMWDVIFAEGIPDVFRTPFQAAPLDIYCDNFYVNRQELIQRRLDEISNASAEKLVEWIECTWQEQHGKTCVGINWELFSGVQQIKELARCIGSTVMTGICERFAMDYRHTRSGLPDLVVWNSNSLKYKIVEVKGPNDRLSTKQHVWLDVLVSLGVDAEVLYVKAVGGRKL